MKKRILSVLLALLLLGSTFCSAAELSPYASWYLDGYGVTITPKEGCVMCVSYLVYGTNVMDCLGAQEILIEEWDGIKWLTTGTFPVEKNPEFYAYGAAIHGGDLYFYGLPGVVYRATITAYAEKDGGSDTGTFTCTPKLCTVNPTN